MSRDGTIDRSMETKSEEILSAGTTVPFPICPQQICVPFPLHLHPLNDRQLKDAWVTPDLERPRPFPNPADDPRLHAIHDRKPPLRLSIARSGLASRMQAQLSREERLSTPIPFFRSSQRADYRFAIDFNFYGVY